MSYDRGKFFTNYSFEYTNENVRVGTSSFQEVPSNKNPLINLTMNGILRPSEKIHEIKMKFEGDIPQKDILTESYGTFVLCKDVYNARNVIKTKWVKETDTLTIIIDLRPYHVRLKRPAQFSFSIQINDCGGTCEVKIKQKGSKFTVKYLQSCLGQCYCVRGVTPGMIGRTVTLNCVQQEPPAA